MAHQRAGGGKLCSPHSVKAFGDKNPPKMGRFYPNWIILFIFIHLNAFGVEKVEESSHETMFTGRTQFGKTRFETFQVCFEA